MPARLNRCLNPRTIAVIGGSEAARVIQQCHKLGFGGDIWPVNPKRDSIAGLRCYDRVDDLPRAPDAAFIAIPAEPTIDAVGALARQGAGGAVCYASGFKETGGDTGGDTRHHRLLQAADAMPIIGPNCYGFLNLTCGAALWPDYHGAARVEQGVAIFSQSGNVSLNLSMQRRRLPLAWLVSLGNQAMVGMEEGIAAALESGMESDHITAIGLHVEGLNDLPLFARLAQRARERGLPIVVLKSGRSEAGARITMSHTATLAGESALYDALFAQLGIAQVATPEEFIETLKLLSIGGALGGNRLASMSCSGGEATLVADLAMTRAMEFPALTDSHRQQVQATLNEYVRVDNPLDYHTFIWGDCARMTATFSAMMAGRFDLTLLILDTPADDAEALEIWMQAVRAFIHAVQETGCRGAVVASLSESMPEEVAQCLIENGIAPLQGLEQALAAVEAAYTIGQFAKSIAESGAKKDTDLPALAPLSPAAELRQYDEHAAKKLLAQSGLSVPPGLVVASVDEAITAARELGYPVVVKALSADILHKTEKGAVAIDLRDDQQVRAQATRMLGQTETPLVETLLVEKMVDGAVAELLLGLSHDPQFGHYLIIGFGGTLVDLIRDRELLLLPVDENRLIRALDRLQTAPLLHGYRGQPMADVDGVVASALLLGELAAKPWASDHGMERVVEIEINPLMVMAKNKGVIVADALVITQPADQGGEHTYLT